MISHYGEHGSNPEWLAELRAIARDDSARYYYCDQCDEVMPESETRVIRDNVTSEHFGAVATTQTIAVVDDLGHEVVECVPCQQCFGALPVSGSDFCAICGANES